MDFVYFCRPGENEELRYSIRSLYKNYPNPNVWVVGGKPDWYVGNFLPVAQSSSKFSNVMQSIRAVLDSDLISNTFVLMNDDFFILKPISEIPVLHGGDINNKIERYLDIIPSSGYVRMLQATRDKLNKIGINNVLNYDLHVPMTFSKAGLSKSLYVGTLWRSMYGNLMKLGGEQIEDVKIYVSGIFKNYETMPFESFDTFMSTDEISFNLVADKLAKMFNKKSVNES